MRKMHACLETQPIGPTGQPVLGAVSPFRRGTGRTDAGFPSVVIDGASGHLSPQGCFGREERNYAGEGEHQERAVTCVPLRKNGPGP